MDEKNEKNEKLKTVKNAYNFYISKNRYSSIDEYLTEENLQLLKDKYENGEYCNYDKYLKNN